MYSLSEKLIFRASREVAEEANLQGKAGLLCDSTFGQDVLNDVTGRGWWIGRPIELPASRPLCLEHGNIGSQLVSWPKEHIVKCLVFFHPEDNHPLRLEQEKRYKRSIALVANPAMNYCLKLFYRLIWNVMTNYTSEPSNASITLVSSQIGGNCRH